MDYEFSDIISLKYCEKTTVKYAVIFDNVTVRDVATKFVFRSLNFFDEASSSKRLEINCRHSLFSRKKVRRTSTQEIGNYKQMSFYSVPEN